MTINNHRKVKEEREDIKAWGRVNDRYCSKTINSTTKQVAHYSRQKEFAKVLTPEEVKEMNTIEPKGEFWGKRKKRG